jgi:hypothetical protein
MRDGALQLAVRRPHALGTAPRAAKLIAIKLCVWGVTSVALPAHAGGEVSDHHWQPDATFAQLGGSSSADNWTLGLQWAWQRDWQWGSSVQAQGHWELSAGRWASKQNWRNDNRDWVTQITFTPMLRLTTPRSSGWYVDVGAGPTLLLPVYISRERTFSTQFNFQTQLAAGRLLGTNRQHDLAVCIAHISNAEIEQPNPGLNLYALRYTWRFSQP